MPGDGWRFSERGLRMIGEFQGLRCWSSEGAELRLGIRGKEINW